MGSSIVTKRRTNSAKTAAALAVGALGFQGGADASVLAFPSWVDFVGGPNQEAYQFVLTVPPGLTTITVDATGGGAGGGGGSVTNGVNITGGGGGSGGGACQDFTFRVFPGEKLYCQVGGGGIGGLIGADGTDGGATYIRRQSHTGPVILTVPGGLKGLGGTVTTSGKGGDAPGGTFGGSAPAGGAGRTTAGAGNSGGHNTITSSRDFTPGGLSIHYPAAAGGGAFVVVASPAAVNGGGSGVSLLNVGNSAGGTGVAAPLVVPGGAGSCAAQGRFRSDNGASGGGAHGWGWDGMSYGTGGGGGAGGFPGGNGCAGHLRMLLPATASIPPSQIIYSGAGVTVPSDFVGMHLTMPYGRSNTVVGQPNGGEAGKVLLNIDQPAPGTISELVFTGGTPPTTAEIGQLQLGVVYHVIPKSSASNYCWLSTTRNGDKLTITSTGTGAVANYNNATPERGLAYGSWRSLQAGLRWAQLNPSNGVFVETELRDRVDYCVRNGLSISYAMQSTPSWASSSAGGTPDVWGAPNGAYPPASQASLSAFVTWLVTKINVEWYPTEKPLKYIEVWNEPAFPGTASGYFCGTAAQLAEMARTIYQAAKAVDSSIKILSPAFSGGVSVAVNTGILSNQNTVYAFMTASDNNAGLGRNWVDGVAFHPYDSHTSMEPNASTGTVNSRSSLYVVNAYRRLLAQCGLPNAATIPLYNTEWGMSSLTDWPWLSDIDRVVRPTVCWAALGMAMCNLFGYNGVHSRYTNGNAELQRRYGDIHRLLAGRTITYCAQYHDGTIVTRTSDGSTVKW